MATYQFSALADGETISFSPDDADGNGSGAAQLIATLATIPTIAATDIAVI